ncbi:hypothetical protein D7033_01725 [Aquimarina sp. AD10]|nr:hypothetical protein D7033_01725 [Aquimarina sp. AD10]
MYVPAKQKVTPLLNFSWVFIFFISNIDPYQKHNAFLIRDFSAMIIYILLSTKFLYQFFS